MATSFGALCTDFFVNFKLALKLDLPAERETVLHFFDRIRKSHPDLNRFRRYDGELALESSRREPQYRWLSLRQHSVRAGQVNPESLETAYAFQRLLLEQAPYHLTISPLDVDYLELVYGFELECDGNHDEIVYEALFADSPVGALLAFEGEDEPRVKVLDVQPTFGLSLGRNGEVQASFEVKTRPRNRRGSARSYQQDPISLLLTLRRYGPVDDLKELEPRFNELAQLGEALANDRLVPDLLTPIARQITGRPA